ncbi:unnamed protein product, partial [Pocillopora meandrina]
MAENASKEPRNTAKSPYYWDMMRLLDNARKEGELTDVTLRRLSNWNRRRSLRNRSRMDRAKSRREGATFCGVRLSSISDQYLYTKPICSAVVPFGPTADEKLLGFVNQRTHHSRSSLSWRKCIYKSLLLGQPHVKSNNRLVFKKFRHVKSNNRLVFKKFRLLFIDLVNRFSKKIGQGSRTSNQTIDSFSKNFRTSNQTIDSFSKNFDFFSLIYQQVSVVPSSTCKDPDTSEMNIKYRQYICNSIRTFRACFAIGIQNDIVWSRAKCFFSGGDICSVLLRDQVYLFGGTGSQSVNRQNSRMVECYDIKSNTWLDAHSMPYNDTYFKG